MCTFKKLLLNCFDSLVNSFDKIIFRTVSNPNLMSTPDSVKQIQKNLTASKLNAIIAKMKIFDVFLNLSRMNITDNYDLKELFQYLGSTFLSDSATSDLSLMVAKNSLRQKRGREISAVEQLDFLRHLTGHTNFGLYVGKMINKVYLGIDEIGTVGAAVTISASSRTMPDVVFRVDTPFMFVIRHNPTKIPTLFYGLVLDPTTT